MTFGKIEVKGIYQCHGRNLKKNLIEIYICIISTDVLKLKNLV